MRSLPDLLILVARRLAAVRSSEGAAILSEGGQIKTNNATVQSTVAASFETIRLLRGPRGLIQKVCQLGLHGQWHELGTIIRQGVK